MFLGWFRGQLSLHFEVVLYVTEVHPTCEGGMQMRLKNT